VRTASCFVNARSDALQKVERRYQPRPRTRAHSRNRDLDAARFFQLQWLLAAWVEQAEASVARARWLPARATPQNGE
jgi:hypothetical protein